ncbi:AraC family transcriptional regulator [Aestuariirhabdus sp. Z084]|uniref:AraC family transcriptional regulator n=1 Tax=Aestuariirhabdus haliotis TaxID=2918751 RepID=UPI00201B3B5A|nr:AraC family transcriptional regulator [Aestuariirhabdus haliotis]MCL6415716.1 AraC family transcriptional regulator [Aestuariirhabdus haliotis]MCL6419758.1 AraC family transcriptional regulator [Aestuariirhabdus haliotis]
MAVTHYINNSYLLRFSELVLARRGNMAQLYQLAGLNMKAVQGDNVLIPLAGFVRLLDISAEYLDFPDIGLALASKQDVSTLSPLVLMLSNCQTVEDMIDTVVKYFQVIVSGISMKVVRQGDSITLQFETSLRSLMNSVQFQDYVLAATTKTLREVTGNKYPLRSVYFVREDSDSARLEYYTSYFACPIAYGSERLQLVIDNKVLSESIDIFAHLASARMQMMLESRQDIADDVMKIIGLYLPSGNVTIDSVAQSLGYTRRTLQRRLDDASTTFSALIEAERAVRAEQYLKHTRYRLTDIAALLGYSNLSSFSRSCQRWYGVDPGSIRKAQQDDPANAAFPR